MDNLLEEVLKNIVQFVVPVISLFLSIYVLYKSKKTDEYDYRIKKCDAEIKELQLEVLKKETVIDALVQAEIVKDGNQYYIVLSNVGSEPAYETDYSIDKSLGITCIKKVCPFERLDPGCKVKEKVIVSNKCRKYSVDVSWKDEDEIIHNHNSVGAI